MQAPSSNKMVARVYFASDKREDCGQDNVFCLKPVPRTVSSLSPARDVLEALIAGPTAEEVSTGLYAPYTNDLIIERITIAKGVARVSLRSKDPTLIRWPGDMAPATFRAAIDQTLKQFPTVRRVFICLDGIASFDDAGEGPRKKCR
jgi:hypothetical protein